MADESQTPGPTDGYIIYIAEQRELLDEGRARFEAGQIAEPGDFFHPTHEGQRVVETSDGPMLEELRTLSSLKVEDDPERQGQELVGLVREIYAEAHRFYMSHIPSRALRNLPPLPEPADLPIFVDHAEYFSRWGD